MNVFRKLLILPYTIGGSNKAFINKNVLNTVIKADINNEKIFKLSKEMITFWKPDYSENAPEKGMEYKTTKYNITVSDPNNLLYIEIKKDIDKAKAKQRADYKARAFLKLSVHVSGPAIFSGKININEQECELSPYFVQILCNHMIGLYKKQLRKNNIAKQLKEKNDAREQQKKGIETKRQSALDFQKSIKLVFGNNCKKL